MEDRRKLPAIEEELLPAISAAAGAGHGVKLRGYIKKALSLGVPMSHVEEVILQCYLFAGFPAALEGLVVLRQVAGGRTPSRGRRRSPPVEEIVERGHKLCRRVYGDKYESLKRRSLELHPDMWDWMIGEGYGKVLSRPPLSPAVRELCVIATLVVTGWARQLRSHVHGALNVGCSPDSVMRAVRSAGRVAGPESYKWARLIASREISSAEGRRNIGAGRSGTVKPKRAADGRRGDTLSRLRRGRSRSE